MNWLNEHEIAQAVRVFQDDQPNLQAAAKTLQSLVDWANKNSDGWSSWPKPARAAAKLQNLVGESFSSARADITEDELKTALRPVRAFYTRQGVDYLAVQV